MSYITLRGCWCDINVLNVHEPVEDKTDDTKNSFYEELEHVFNHFLKYHINILSSFSAKIGREDIFKPTVRNESLHKISSDNGDRIVKHATSKNLIVKSKILYLHIHKHFS
jgi:hypothetical protein